MDAEAYKHFGREYCRLHNRAAEMALLQLHSESEVEHAVAYVVQLLDRALAGEDVNVAYLAVSHVLEHHLMQMMAGR